MPFVPAGSDHAVVANSFTLALTEPIADQRIKALKAQPAPWISSLPAARDTTGIEIQVGADTPMLRRATGIEYAFLRPDGNSTWSLTVSGSEISVTCEMYTRWAKVWSQARELLGQATSLIAKSGQTRLASLSMQVVDRFVSDSQSDAPRDFLASSPLIAATLFDKPSLWHQHLGWFEPHNTGELLHNVNMDLVWSDPSDRSKGKTLNVLHLQRLTYTTPTDLNDDENYNTAQIDDAVTAMHIANKATLEALLSAAMRKKIGLGG